MCDFNNDGLIDILITYKIAENNQHIFLYLNRGDFKFFSKADSTFLTDIAPSTLSTISADFNNDGFPDVLVYNNEEKLKFLINKGDASFVDAADSVGFSTSFFHPEPSGGIIGTEDVNNDGWLDIFIGSKLFLCSPPLPKKAGYPKYFEIGKHVGIDFLGNPSFADVDGDGDIDLFLGSSRSALGNGDRAALYRNNLIDRNFLKINIKPDVSNRDGIGTKIFLEEYDAHGQIIYKTVRQVGLGTSAIAQSYEMPVTFGVNPGSKYKITVMFPSGIKRVIDNPEKNRITTIYESSMLDHYAVLLQKSINRTLLLIDWKIELIKFLIMLSLLIALYYYGIKTKAAKIVRRWYLATGFVLFYIMLIHISITLNQLFSGIISIGLTALTAGAFVVAAGIYYEKKESKFISHYKLVEIIGVGGMGKVFKAIDTQNGQIVAVKVLNPQVLKEEENKKRLSSEGMLLSSFNHRHIVKVFEFGETEKHTFIVMEYLNGGTLDDFVNKNCPLTLKQFIDISSQICEGLAVIHSHNIVHRDLKSQNIMFDENGTIRIMDFGLSKSPLVSTMTSLGTVVGTLGYVAPEQVTNIQVDQRTDIFSLGVIFYQMLAGELPFKGENEMALIHSIFNTVPPNLSEINPLIPSKLNEVVFKCISKNANERYSSANEVLNVLKNI